MSILRCNQGRVAPQLIIAPLLLLIAASSIFFWYANKDEDPDELRVSGIVEGDLLLPGSKVGGRLGELLVDEGQEVAEGDLLARFDIPELEARHVQLLALLDETSAMLDKAHAGARPQEIASASAGVSAAKAQLAELENGSRAEDIQAAKAGMQAVEANLTLARADLSRAEELFNADVMPRKDLDAAATAVESLEEQLEVQRQIYEKTLAGPRSELIDVATAQLDAARSSLSLVQAGTRSEDIAAAEARLTMVEAQLTELEALMAEAEVIAPADGVILARNHLPGDLVQGGAPVVTLLAGGTYFVQTFIPEQYLSWAPPGATAALELDPFPGRSFTGFVEFLSISGEFTPRNLQTKETRAEQVFRCRIDIDDPEDLLRPGMACDVVFSRPGDRD